jgi:hypothetical protein
LLVLTVLATGVSGQRNWNLKARVLLPMDRRPKT